MLRKSLLKEYCHNKRGKRERAEEEQGDERMTVVFSLFSTAATRHCWLHELDGKRVWEETHEVR